MGYLVTIIAVSLREQTKQAKPSPAREKPALAREQQKATEHRLAEVTVAIGPGQVARRPQGQRPLQRPRRASRVRTAPAAPGKSPTAGFLLLITKKGEGARGRKGVCAF